MSVNKANILIMNKETYQEGRHLFMQLFPFAQLPPHPPDSMMDERASEEYVPTASTENAWFHIFSDAADRVIFNLECFSVCKLLNEIAIMYLSEQTCDKLMKNVVKSAERKLDRIDDNAGLTGTLVAAEKIFWTALRSYALTMVASSIVLIGREAYLRVTEWVKWKLRGDENRQDAPAVLIPCLSACPNIIISRWILLLTRASLASFGVAFMSKDWQVSYHNRLFPLIEGAVFPTLCRIFCF